MPTNPTPRRGSVRPLADVTAPAHLDHVARAAFAAAVNSRPGYWTGSDLHLLEAYAVTFAWLRAAHIDPANMDGKSYKDAVSTLITLSKALRLAPLTRADAESHVHTPAHEGSALHEAQGTVTARLPWQTAAGNA